MKALNPQREKGVILLGMEVGVEKEGEFGLGLGCAMRQLARQNLGLKHTARDSLECAHQFTKHPHTCPSYRDWGRCRAWPEPSPE